MQPTTFVNDDRLLHALSLAETTVVILHQGTIATDHRISTEPISLCAKPEEKTNDGN